MVVVRAIYCRGVSICYVLPVLCTSSYLHMTSEIGDTMKTYSQIGSMQGSTNFTAQRILKLDQQRAGAESDMRDCLVGVSFQ